MSGRKGEVRLEAGGLEAGGLEAEGLEAGRPREGPRGREVAGRAETNRLNHLPVEQIVLFLRRRNPCGNGAPKKNGDAE